MLSLFIHNLNFCDLMLNVYPRNISLRFAFGNKTLSGRCESRRPALTQAAIKSAEVEMVDVPQYPKIEDTAFRASKERKHASWRKYLHQVPTVEEKILYINMPRYYGYKVVRLSNDTIPYNCLPAIQHYTRTIVENMPEIEQSDTLVKQVGNIENDIKDAVELSYDTFRLKYPNSKSLSPHEIDQLLSQTIVEQINRAVINNLSDDYVHLKEMEVDYNPRHEAFWVVGAIDPPKNVVKSKEGRSWQKEMAKDKVDRFMQYKSTPLLTLRHRFQLQPWKHNFDGQNRNETLNVPQYELDPRTLGFCTDYQHGINIPGYWPSSMANFGYLAYHSRAFMHKNSPKYEEKDHIESLYASAIQSSFAWLLAQANYNGFNTYTELTYPFNTQTIITNGRLWSFYEYQMNTLIMHDSEIEKNPRVNYCRGTNVLALYEDVDDKGRIQGFNNQVLYHLIKCYTNLPDLQRPNKELQPYLGNKVQRIADYSDTEKREFLEKTFKHLAANRPRHLPIPEIYLWEKIYKIDHNTRPMDARRRFFELEINPWRRTLDQHAKEYIPKAVRPGGPKSKHKWKQTYYPVYDSEKN